MADERSMRFRGDGVNVNRYRVSKDKAEVHLYLDVRGEHSVAELLDVINEAGAPTHDVTFRGGTYRFTVPATDADLHNWAQVDAEQADRAQESRRRQYEHLRAEFEPTP